jgi:peptidoglycan/LPS O-acetylase OafA/YrhL
VRRTRVKRFYSAKFAAPQGPSKPGRDLALEGMRGICACLVLYGHATIPQTRLDPDFSPSPRFWWFNLGHVAVLFFFVLSGYVIGLTVRSPFSGAEARRYLGRRVMRLVPINTAAVLLSWIFIPQVALVTVFGNLAFLQNFHPYPFGLYFDVMPNDLNLWSLNFEAFYYVAFLVIWYLAPRCGPVLAVAALATLAAAFIPGDHVLAAGYIFGALYWFGGLAVAWLAPVEGRPGNWPSALLTLLVMFPLAPFQHLLFALHVPDPIAPLPVPSFHRLDLLAASLWALLAITGRSPLWQRRLGLFCLAIASAALIRSIFSHDGTDTGALVCYGAALAVAWVRMGWRPIPSALAKLAPLGAISFGVYAVGFPLQFALLKAQWLPAGSIWTYAARVVLLVALTFGVGWILERKLQPALRRSLASRP